MEYSKLMMKVLGHEPKPCPRTPLNWSIIVELASLTKEQMSGRRGDGFVSVSGNPHITPSPCTNYAPPSVRHRTDDRNRDEHFLCRMADINTAHEGYMAQRTRGSESMTTAAVQWTAPKAAHRLTHTSSIRWRPPEATRVFRLTSKNSQLGCAPLFQWSDPITQVQPANIRGFEGASCTAPLENRSNVRKQTCSTGRWTIRTWKRKQTCLPRTC